MKFLISNTRGCGSDTFMRHLTDLLRYQDPTVLILLETKIKEEAADRVCSRINFANSHRVDGNGAKGGIWVFWHPAKVHIDIVHQSSQAIHMVIQVISSSSPFLFTAIYASPHRSLRQFLWCELINFSKNCPLPWLIGVILKR